MAKAEKLPRKTNKEVLQAEGEPDIIQAHIDDWHFLRAGLNEKLLEVQRRCIDLGHHSTFNFYAASKTLKYRQMGADGELTTPFGKIPYLRGDYMLVDQQNGKIVIPYKLFKLEL